MSDNKAPEEWWHALLTGNNPEMPLRQARRVFSLMSGHARCKFCNAPFDGKWAPLTRLMGRGPSRLTSQFCIKCQAILEPSQYSPTRYADDAADRAREECT